VAAAPARRVGLLGPSSNTVVEPDFARHVADGVTLHTARMQLREASAADERVMVTVHAPKAAEDLGTLRPDLVAFCCTSAGAVLGTDGEDELIKRLASATGADVVSTNAAVHAYLRRAGFQRIFVVTPYIQELNDEIASTLKDRGFDVAHICGMGIEENFELAMVPPQTIEDYVMSSVGDRRDFDAIFISCTNYRAWEVRDRLSEATGKPVVTSNQATFDEVMARLDMSLGLP
jgi:maleate isomerase